MQIYECVDGGSSMAGPSMLLSNIKLKPGEDNLVVEALTIELDLNVGTPEDGFMIEYYTDSTTSALTFTECDPNRGAAFRCAIAFHCPLSCSRDSYQRTYS